MHNKSFFLCFALFVLLFNIALPCVTLQYKLEAIMSQNVIMDANIYFLGWNSALFHLKYSILRENNIQHRYLDDIALILSHFGIGRCLSDIGVDSSQ